jgi:hypothetical protein
LNAAASPGAFAVNTAEIWRKASIDLVLTSAGWLLANFALRPSRAAVRASQYAALATPASVLRTALARLSRDFASVLRVRCQRIVTLAFEGAQSLRVAAGQFWWRHDHPPLAQHRNYSSSQPAATSQRSELGSTKRTCRGSLPMSARRAKADIPPRGGDFRF